MDEAGQDGRLIGELLRVPYQAVVDHAHGAFAAAGLGDLRPAHLSLFQHIDHPPGGTRLTTLAERAQMTKQAMGELVEHLARQGYVERIPDPADRRAKLVRLTAQGWAIHEAAGEVVKQLEVAWVARLGERKMAQLRGLLQELSTALER